MKCRKLLPCFLSWHTLVATLKTVLRGKWCYRRKQSGETDWFLFSQPRWVLKIRIAYVFWFHSLSLFSKCSLANCLILQIICLIRSFLLLINFKPNWNFWLEMIKISEKRNIRSIWVIQGWNCFLPLRLSYFLAFQVISVGGALWRVS